jgi:hypothetical protein
MILACSLAHTVLRLRSKGKPISLETVTASIHLIALIEFSYNCKALQLTVQRDSVQ